MVEEELVPKETGREAMLEKRRQKGAYTRVDNDAGGMVGVQEADAMGGDSKSDFRRMVQSRDSRFQRKYVKFSKP